MITSSLITADTEQVTFCYRTRIKPSSKMLVVEYRCASFYENARSVAGEIGVLNGLFCRDGVKVAAVGVDWCR